MIPPKPPARDAQVPLWRYARAFRRDILSAQPARLYRARMAEFRTPFFRSFLVNEPDLIREILSDRPADFPKSTRVTEGLRPLLGDAVFVTNGAQWARQRRIIDPAFQGGRLDETFPAMLAAGRAALARLRPGSCEVEAIASHAAADVIFRTLFSVPIEDRMAGQVAQAFTRYQRHQPILNIAALLPMPRWMPRFHRRAVRRAAAEIRTLVAEMVTQRERQIDEGTAPDDLATKLLTFRDPVTGEGFAAGEMTDQVAIFFLAGHETSAAALSWALYLLATHPEAQDRVADEAAAFTNDPSPATLKTLRFTRDVFREALRLYPPVPMMVRAASVPEEFRGRAVPKGAQIVLSPWHLHRHERHWDNPDAFDPDRWQTAKGRDSARAAYMPFSAGPRVCPGAGFAMAEGTLLLALLVDAFRFAPIGPPPVPVAHLTVRSRNGIKLELSPRK